jgi:methylthioribose-1-phosphate isomerase
MRTVDWDPQIPVIRIIDQRDLPVEKTILKLSSVDEVASAIRDMAVRGAPAIGVTAAFGLALSAILSSADSVKGLWRELEAAAGVLRASRPTASNLNWALDRLLRIALSSLEENAVEIRFRLIAEAQQIADEDVEINKRIGEHGAALIKDGDTVIHHCNTGALATVDYGTALGVIRTAHTQGKRVHVLVGETRPRLQGARLTAWELDQYGIPYEIITDNASGYYLKNGSVAAAFVGADSVAANGDVANKIGTYMLALAAFDNSVPLYCVIPTSTVDLNMASGDTIPIEERDPSEVLDIQRDGKAIAPPQSRARNPAFDVTPHRLISAFVTETGVIRPPFPTALRRAVEEAQNS